MTPKEKAEQLVKSYEILIKYDSITDLSWRDPSPANHEYHDRVRKDAKLYALRAVDEVIELLYRIDTYVAIADNKNIPNVKYWRDVKIKIKAIKSYKTL